MNKIVIALLIALLPTIPSSSTTIGTQDIRDGAVTNVKVASAIDAVKIGDGSVSNTEFQRLDGVTSGIQTQIDGKAATSHAHAAGDITSGALALARGGTNADLSASGSTTAVLAQDASHVVSARALVAGDLPNHSAALITSGTLALARGGTNADLSATGGASQVLKQTSSGGAITVGQLAASNLSDGTSGSGAIVLATNATLTGPVIAAGTASANSWPIMTSGTVLTSPVAGAIEYDGTAFYATAVASARQVIPAEQFIISSAAYTLISQTGIQPIFNANANGETANGALTVVSNTTYFVEGVIYVSSMSSTTGNGFLDLLGTGTATFTSGKVFVMGADAGNQIAMAQSVITASSTTFAGGGNMFVNSTSTSMSFCFKGVMRVNAGGTIIPSLAQTTAAAAVVGANSYLRFTPVGSGSVVRSGNWS